jgi:hypothetical protein
MTFLEFTHLRAARQALHVAVSPMTKISDRPGTRRSGPLGTGGLVTVVGLAEATLGVEARKGGPLLGT